MSPSASTPHASDTRPRAFLSVRQLELTARLVDAFDFVDVLGITYYRGDRWQVSEPGEWEARVDFLVLVVGSEGVARHQVLGVQRAVEWGLPVYAFAAMDAPAFPEDLGRLVTRSETLELRTTDPGFAAEVGRQLRRMLGPDHDLEEEQRSPLHHPLESGSVPSWATSWGHDRYGPWAAFALGEVEMRMRWVQPGRFKMGSKEGDSQAYPHEHPLREVTITQGFWLGETAVTQEQWRAGCEEFRLELDGSPSTFPEGGDSDGLHHPVEGVSWEGVHAWLAGANRAQQGRQLLRLPSEAEWEYACRAGSASHYSWGDDADPRRARCGWLEASSDEEKAVARGTMPVRSYEPNPWGFAEMHGNVWEWCEDWFGRYDSEDVIDPAGPTEGSRRVVRGGSWFDITKRLRSAYRVRLEAVNSFNYLGFRLARGQESGSWNQAKAASTDPSRSSAPRNKRSFPGRGKAEPDEPGDVVRGLSERLHAAEELAQRELWAGLDQIEKVGGEARALGTREGNELACVAAQRAGRLGLAAQDLKYAEIFLEQALNLYQRLLPRRLDAQGVAEMDLARLRLAQGIREEAIEHLERAARVAGKRSDGPSRAIAAEAHLHLGDLLLFERANRLHEIRAKGSVLPHRDDEKPLPSPTRAVHSAFAEAMRLGRLSRTADGALVAARARATLTLGPDSGVQATEAVGELNQAREFLKPHLEDPTAQELERELVAAIDLLEGSLP